jgi:hypothetical protein
MQRTYGVDMAHLPPPPGILYGYQKKGVVGGAIRMDVKTKELRKGEQPRILLVGELFGGQKAQIGASYTGQSITENIWSQYLFI